MNQNPILTLNLDLNEINAVLAALQELPGKVCNPLTQKITEQAKAQIAELQAAVPQVEKVEAGLVD